MVCQFVGWLVLMAMNNGCPFTEEASNWLVVGALASPHILYACIWYFPQIWMKIYGRWSVQVFESLAWILKCAIDGCAIHQCGRFLMTILYSM